LEESNVLGTSGRPTENRLQWIAAAGPKVPVEVAASGPRVISVAARVADRITFAVGADLARLQWAIDVALEALKQAGRGTDEVELGACVPVVVAPSRAEGRALLSSGLARYARFSVMHGSVAGPTSSEGRAALEQMQQSYNMNHHSLEGAAHGSALTDDLVDAFSVTGPVDYCIERLRAMVGLGLTKLMVPPVAFRTTSSQAASAQLESDRLLVKEVLPAVR
jgi:5,10-methylenetetrahydromethanopterin reductase